MHNLKYSNDYSVNNSKSRVKKSIISCFLLLVIMTVFNACGKESKDVKTEQKTEVLSDQELEELSAKAKDYFKNAKLVEMIETYRKMVEGGCTKGDLLEFGDRSVEEALKTQEERTQRNYIVCRYATMAVNDLKNQLKDPGSLVIYAMHLHEDESDPTKLRITFDYGAKNSFGGMVRDEYVASYTVSESERDAIYQSLKAFMDEKGATSKDSVRYLCGNYNITEESQYEAIVNGTATYK